MFDTIATTFTRIYSSVLLANAFGRTTGVDIFQTINDFFREVGLFWTDYVDIADCTDGASVMTERTAGFRARVWSAQCEWYTYYFHILCGT